MTFSKADSNLKFYETYKRYTNVKYIKYIKYVIEIRMD